MCLAFEKVRRNIMDWLTKPAVLQNSLQAQYPKNVVIIWNKSKQRDVKLKSERNFHEDMVNISTDIISGEMQDGKKKKKKLFPISDIPFTIANSQTVFCFYLAFMVRTGTFWKGHFSTTDTIFTINTLHTLNVAVLSVILNKPKFSSALVFCQTVQAHSYSPPFIWRKRYQRS